ISFTDSIPIVALMVRPLSPLLPQPFQYLGLYVCASFALLAYLGFKIFQRLCGGNVLWALLGGFLILLSPVATFRLFGHFALTSHWLILWALYQYFGDDLRSISASASSSSWSSSLGDGLDRRACRRGRPEPCRWSGSASSAWRSQCRPWSR